MTHTDNEDSCGVSVWVCEYAEQQVPVCDKPHVLPLNAIT
jgi:hypothetical protein